MTAAAAAGAANSRARASELAAFDVHAVMIFAALPGRLETVQTHRSICV